MAVQFSQSSHILTRAATWSELCDQEVSAPLYVYMHKQIYFKLEYPDNVWKIRFLENVMIVNVRDVLFVCKLLKWVLKLFEMYHRCLLIEF